MGNFEVRGLKSTSLQIHQPTLPPHSQPFSTIHSHFNDVADTFTDIAVVIIPLPKCASRHRHLQMHQITTTEGYTSDFLYRHLSPNAARAKSTAKQCFSSESTSTATLRLARPIAMCSRHCYEGRLSSMDMQCVCTQCAIRTLRVTLSASAPSGSQALAIGVICALLHHALRSRKQSVEEQIQRSKRISRQDTSSPQPTIVSSTYGYRRDPEVHNFRAYKLPEADLLLLSDMVCAMSLLCSVILIWH